MHIPKLLIVSYDAFRYDYFDRNMTPFLEMLKRNNTYVDYMKNVFITKTFPNHQTIATGLFVESHGVIDSEFYDKKSGRIIKYSEELYNYNNNILPIWILNENSDRNRHSGVMMWPGIGFKYHGSSPTFELSWNISVSWRKRIDILISWFNHPKTPINFGMLYIEEPDFHGHGIGINNANFNKVLVKLDNITKYLHDTLKEKSLNDVNVIHLSDHGMSTVTIDRIINLTNYINPSDYIYAGLSPVTNIYPKAGKETLIYTNLSIASKRTKKFNVYLKKEIPKIYHFSDNTRVGPILVVAKPGYAFETFYDNFPWYEKEFNITVNEKSEFGVHGYDNNASEMYPFFFGVGPAFKAECKMQPFNNIDLLPLFCEILNVQCDHINGTLGDLQKCLTKHNYKETFYSSVYIGGAVISVLGIVILYLILLRKRHIEKYNTIYRARST
ncbi:PREDICTED: bis(5'-adenosyl)-triphosphatase enpp4-like [Ceratosolen solmsi marchali]|uniref:Bis(5'-adenosyl)-triphosphatase enpp4-like n=1 Tax=Ceratosolen solmsi marchali TaxID=326594 RepID=A0AAJ6YR63_9HYME|nr:PREDICTED: bis(5'-adenosyl)-triphosphatase enpp4-like [Ceratosolen solmsi marchali]